MKDYNYIRIFGFLLIILAAGCKNNTTDPDPSDTLPVPIEGLTAYYPFTGNTNDASGNNHNGQNTGAILTTDKKGSLNSAYHFNTSAKGVEIDHGPVFNTLPKTIGFWLKADVEHADGWVLGKARLPLKDGYGFYLQDDRIKFVLFLNETNTTSAISLYPQDKKWHHIAVTIENSGPSIYVDGNYQGKGPAWTGAPVNTEKFTLGFLPNDIKPPFEGSLDEVVMYNRALTAAEIQHLAQ